MVYSSVNWVKVDINVKELLTEHGVKIMMKSHSSWSEPIIVVPKGDGGKHLVIDNRALNKVTWKFVWPMPRAEDIFSKLYSTKEFSMLNLHAGPP